MKKDMLSKYHEVRPDACSVVLPPITWSVKQMLNRQTGFNRSLLESYEECGCFHCGRRFPTSLVSDWMVEPGEEDTGRCPYCGEDALIVGTEEFPLSTALLTSLYLDWFETECKEREKLATDIPPFKGISGYLIEGVPFRWRRSRGRRRLAKIAVWSYGDPGEGRYDCEGSEKPGVYTDASLGGVWHLRAWEEEVDDGLTEEEIEQLDDEAYWNRVDVIEHYELVRDGEVVRFSPWSGDEQLLIVSLYEKYGDNLLAVIKNPGCSEIEVFAEDDS